MKAEPGVFNGCDNLLTVSDIAIINMSGIMKMQERYLQMLYKGMIPPQAQKGQTHAG